MRRYIALFLISLFLFTSCAGTTGWTLGEKVLGTVAVTGCLADNYTTRKGLTTGGYEETNVILGDDPSETALNLWTVALIVGGLILANYADDYRPYILGAIGTLSWYGAIHNYKLLKDNNDW